jgi:hypothetical protein
MNRAGIRLGPTFEVWKLRGEIDIKNVRLATDKPVDCDPRVYTLVSDVLPPIESAFAFANDEGVRLVGAEKPKTLVSDIPDGWVYKGCSFYSFLRARPARDLKKYMGLLQPTGAWS